MGRFYFLVVLAMLGALPAMVIRLTGWHTSSVIEMAFFGVAVLAAGFMLSWSAEAAERDLPQGLILAIVALITVLPEYAVDMYYAFQAGRAPDSQYVHYAAANMTGANRLLVGVAWPIMVILHWWRTREQAIVLAPVNLVEIGFLFVASVYAFIILLNNRIHLWDFAILFTIFGVYLWQAGRMSGREEDNNEAEEPGPAGILTQLKSDIRWIWITALGVTSSVIIFFSAEPFAEAIVASGRRLGVNEFLLIQWLAPLASEAPTITIAILFVVSGKAAKGLAAMISDKINQWTLLVGMLPLAMTIGAGHPLSLPLDPRQHEEFFLTAAQSVFALSLLIRLRFHWLSGLILAGLFIVQVVIAFIHQENDSRVIASLTTLAWLYLLLTLAICLTRIQKIADAMKKAVRNDHD